MERLSFIGMGEAGSAIVSGWGPHVRSRVSAYDLKLDDARSALEITARCESLRIECLPTAGQAVTRSDIVFCTVTADQAVAAARTAADFLRKGTFWCDLNSCAPSSKLEAANIIETAGGRYVDIAVMAPVYPKLNMVPLLLSGPYAKEISPTLEALPMLPRIIDGPVGAASSIKMIRSVMVKGLEALTSECILAAVAAGVEQEVLASLTKSHPGTDWEGQGAYNFERAMVHGVRRAAEMEEVAKTLTDLGLPDDMSRATVSWQRRLSTTGLEAPSDARGTGAKAIALSLLSRLKQGGSGAKGAS